MISKRLRKKLEDIKNIGNPKFVSLVNGIYNEILLRNQYNFLDFEDKMFSYVEEKHLSKIKEEDPFTVKFRKRVKSGKFLKNLNSNLTQQEEDEIIRYLYTEKKEHIFFLTKNISYYYQEDITINTGTISKSCMRWSNCIKKQVVWYDNEEDIDLLVLIRDNIVCARCLIWKQKYFDRIYYGTDNDYVIMSKFLNNKFIDVELVNVEVTVSKKKAEHLPYLDTLKFYDGFDTIDNIGKGKYVIKNSYPAHYYNVFNLNKEKIDVEYCVDITSYKGLQISKNHLTYIGTKIIFKTENFLWQILEKKRLTNMLTQHIQIISKEVHIN